MKALSFSDRAETSLADIFEWTAENFGAAQAQRYSDELLGVCWKIAGGEATIRACHDVFTPHLHADLRFVRGGRHFVIFTETPTQVLILDFIHQSADLIRRLEAPE